MRYALVTARSFSIVLARFVFLFAMKIIVFIKVILRSGKLERFEGFVFTICGDIIVNLNEILLKQSNSSNGYVLQQSTFLSYQHLPI